MGKRDKGAATGAPGSAAAISWMLDRQAGGAILKKLGYYIVWSHLGYRYCSITKAVYKDGHDRIHVVQYREDFVKCWEKHRYQFIKLGILVDPQGVEYLSGPLIPFSPWLPGEGPLFLTTHDEYTFTANDGRHKIWVLDGYQKLRKKSRDAGIMMSGFDTPVGMLRFPTEVTDEILESLNLLRESYMFLELGKTKKGYWRMQQAHSEQAKRTYLRRGGGGRRFH